MTSYIRRSGRVLERIDRTSRLPPPLMIGITIRKYKCSENFLEKKSLPRITPECPRSSREPDSWTSRILPFTRPRTVGGYISAGVWQIVMRAVLVFGRGEGNVRSRGRRSPLAWSFCNLFNRVSRGRPQRTMRDVYARIVLYSKT